MERIELARLLGAPPGAAETAAGPVVIEEREPARFMALLASAVAAGGPVFLADSAWGATERAALSACIGQAPFAPPGRGWLMIPSGGTSGRLKFARHDEQTLSAAVHGFCSHFEVARVSCVGVLPLHHVSGLMAWLRAALTGGEYIPWDWKRLEAGERPPVSRDGAGWFLSLVPTQLQRMLASAESAAWLRKFQAVFIGRPGRIADFTQLRNDRDRRDGGRPSARRISGRGAKLRDPTASCPPRSDRNRAGAGCRRFDISWLLSRLERRG